MRIHLAAMTLALATPVLATPASAQKPSAAREIAERSIDELQAMLARGEISSVALTQGYLARIATLDRAGPRLRSVIALNPQALAQARRADRDRRLRIARGPLFGIPVLIKDNIDSVENATTAGSLALAANFTKRDAPLVARLRAAGAIILGKTNLSEWANIRDDSSMSGWSAVGGLVRNPYALDRTACGSSSGSGAAAAASLAAAAVGTETDGSIICPSAMNGLVGLKPTLGAISRTHVVPISHSQDTPGPMARSVRDAAALFAGMIGSDPADPATAQADAMRTQLTPDWSRASLKGVRLAVLRPQMRADLAAAFDAQLATLKAQGAVLVDVERPKTEGLSDAEFKVLLMELKSDLAAYLATTPSAVKVRTLADTIAFNQANARSEMAYFGQSVFEMAEKTGGTADPGYAPARARSLKLASDALDTMLGKANAEAIVTPSYGLAWLSDPVHGDQSSGPSASQLPAIAGYPHLTVPMGLVKGLPAGLSFITGKWRDGRLLELGYAYEQASRARMAPSYGASVDSGTALEGRADSSE
ncbi:amidase [Sphingomonas turrisvirgatae]|uniref:Amidase n=1 Tax=Sphingomonas turrisvirgatae TaxID=1888892 RepID=A0A1E3LU64_9SPHN|nr:amidase [Sphingomonas turrisvirgatae]ODP37283.1 amidase [Sphingomonas turrisvirgatae]